MATLQRLSRLQTLVFRHSLKCRCQNLVVRHASVSGPNKKLTAPDNQTYVEESQEFETLKKHFENADPKAMKV